jgi:hypothetical protein
MRRLIALAATAALSASPLMISAASAEPPEYSKEAGCGPGKSRTARGVIMIGDGKANGNTIYIDDRDYTPTGGGNGFWIYKEGNKYDFLQRGGTAAVDVTGGGNEICTDPAGIPEEERTSDADGNPTWKPDMCIF